MVNKRNVNKGEEDLDYLASISIQLAFCRGTNLFQEYGKYLVSVNESLRSIGENKLFIEGDLFLKKYEIGREDVSDIDSEAFLF